MDGVFESIPLADAKNVLEQIADISATVQRVKLPDNVSQSGALAIDDSGAIVSVQMPLLKGGPWDTHEETWPRRL